MRFQFTAAMSADTNTLQQGRAFSHDSSFAMRSRASIGVETFLIRFEGCPVNETRMMLPYKHAPLIHREVSHALFDNTLSIDIMFAPAFAVGVSARIHWIAQYVMNRGVSRNNPTNLAVRSVLQREGWRFRTQPKPDAPSGAEFGKTFEDCSNGGGDRFIRMEEDFTIGVSPDETHG